MGDSDLWRQDGSFRGLQGKSSGGKGGKGPEFTRVIPKFLQKYHEPPAIQAKFAPLPMPAGETGEEEEELDDVQKAAIAEFLEKDKAKKDKIANATGAGSGGEEGAKSAGGGVTEKKKKASQAVAGIGGAGQHPKKKRKRKEMTALSNKKLLSFSMDDEE